MPTTNHMWSKIKGARVTNELILGSTFVKLGLDYSKREWEGKYS